VIAEYQAKPGADAVETAAYNEARAVLPDIQDNYIELQGILSDYDAAISVSERSDILNDFGSLKPSLHTESEVDDARARWEAAYPNIAP